MCIYLKVYLSLSESIWVSPPNAEHHVFSIRRLMPFHQKMFYRKTLLSFNPSVHSCSTVDSMASTSDSLSLYQFRPPSQTVWTRMAFFFCWIVLYLFCTHSASLKGCQVSAHFDHLQIGDAFLVILLCVCNSIRSPFRDCKQFSRLEALPFQCLGPDKFFDQISRHINLVFPKSFHFSSKNLY